MPSGRAHYLLKKGAKLQRSRIQPNRYSANLDILNNDQHTEKDEMNIDTKPKYNSSNPYIERLEENKYID